MRFFGIIGGFVIASLVIIGTYYVSIFVLNRKKRSRK